MTAIFVVHQSASASDQSLFYPLEDSADSQPASSLLSGIKRAVTGDLRATDEPVEFELHAGLSESVARFDHDATLAASAMVVVHLESVQGSPRDVAAHLQEFILSWPEVAVVLVGEPRWKDSLPDLSVLCAEEAENRCRVFAVHRDRDWFDPHGVRANIRQTRYSAKHRLQGVAIAHGTTPERGAVASALSSRAERVLHSDCHTLTAVFQAALLAHEALELLRADDQGALELTLASQTALKVLFSAETELEARFSGASRRISIVDKIRDIDSAVHALFGKPWTRPAANPYKDLAVAVDDEWEHAAFNAYVLYRSGWRSVGISRKNALNWWIGRDTDVEIVILDKELDFHDGPSGRSEYWEGARRIVVSTTVSDAEDVFSKPLEGVLDRRVRGRLRNYASTPASDDRSTRSQRPSQAWASISPIRDPWKGLMLESAKLDIAVGVERALAKHNLFEEQERLLHELRVGEANIDAMAFLQRARSSAGLGRAKWLLFPAMALRFFSRRWYARLQMNWFVGPVVSLYLTLLGLALIDMGVAALGDPQTLVLRTVLLGATILDASDAANGQFGTLALEMARLSGLVHLTVFASAMFEAGRRRQ